MPRHNTPHHTDGDGIGKKLKGLKLLERVEHLTTEITKHHRQASAAWKGFLGEAREAGEGHRLKWSKLRHKELTKPGIMSKETSVIYMRIAREWDTPQMKAARDGGIKIDSINKFMEIARCKPQEQEMPSLSKSEELQSMYRDYLRKAFAEKLRRLTPYELDLLKEWGEFDELWDGFYEQLKHGVQVCYGDAYEMDKEEKQNKRNAIRKIKDALNTKRNARSTKANTA